LPEEARRHVETLVDALVTLMIADSTERSEAINESRKALVAAQVAALQARPLHLEANRKAETMEFTNVVARRLQEHRKEATLTQANLASAMQWCGFDKWTRVTVAEVEGGARKVSLDELLALASLYSVPMVDFMLPRHRESVRSHLGEANSSVIRAMVVGPSDGPDWAPARALTFGDEGEDWRPAHRLWANRNEHLDGKVEPGDES